MMYYSRKCDSPKPINCGYMCGANSFKIEMCPSESPRLKVLGTELVYCFYNGEREIMGEVC